MRKAGQKEKVDLAVLLADQPRIYFEVKDLNQPLDGHQGQLARYFNATSTVSLAILTNGVEYRFFTDSEELNIMDTEPFYKARLDSPDPGFDVIARFHKSVFSHEAIREFATELNYRSKMVSFLRRELDLRDREPSEGFVRWVLASDRMYDSRVTANVVERMSPIVKNALAIVLRDVVRRSLAAMDHQVTVAEEGGQQGPETMDDNDPAGDSQLPDTENAETNGAPEEIAPRIDTTENELECFAVIKRIHESSRWNGQTIFDPTAGKDTPIEIAYKDTTGYFGVYFNKPSWWIVRIVAEAKTPWIGFNLEQSVFNELAPRGLNVLNPSPWAPIRVQISGPDDIAKLEPLLIAAFEKTVSDRRRVAPATAT